jgi:hypothetical protein
MAGSSTPTIAGRDAELDAAGRSGASARAVHPASADDETPTAGDPSRFALELHTSGLLGSLNGGVFVGAGTHNVTWGLGFDADYTKLGDQSATDFRIAPGIRVRAASADQNKLDLLIEAEVAWIKNSLSDGNGSVASDGHSFEAAAGPALRYWLTKSLAVSYAALLAVVDHENRNQSYVTLSNVERAALELGEIGPEVRAGQETTVFFTGQLQFTGYF